MHPISMDASLIWKLLCFFIATILHTFTPGDCRLIFQYTDKDIQVHWFVHTQEVLQQVYEEVLQEAPSSC
jgi:hypothetical protein